MEGGLLLSWHYIILIMRCVSIVLVIAMILVNVHGLHLLHAIQACPPLPALAPKLVVRPFRTLWTPRDSPAMNLARRSVCI